MFYEVEYQVGWYGNEPVDRVIYNLLFIQTEVIKCKCVKKITE